MIKINSQKIKVKSLEYIQKMMPLIQGKYSAAKMDNDNNPFTNEPVSKLFEDSEGEFNEEFIKTILIDPFSTKARHVYPQLEFYYKTALLVFYDDFYLKWIIKEKGLTKEEYSNYREEYVLNLNNPWINSYINEPQYMNYKYSWKNYTKLIDCIREKMNQLNKFISKLVDYSFMKAEIRHLILTNSEISVCPYCNRQYITNFSRDGGLRTTSDLDHFYPKSAFQLYSLALLNFVPACTICNSRFKKARKIKILYPYENGFDDRAVFKVLPNSVNDIDSLMGNTGEFKLVLEVDNSNLNSDEVKGHIEMFHLEEVYQSHKNFVQELLYKRKAYSSTYKEMTEQLLQTKLSKDEFNLFLFGFTGNEKDLLNKPLSKLAIDILELYKKS